MSGKQQKTLAPRLRFPEFRDAGEWEVKRLGEIGTISKGKGIPKSDIVESGVLPCIRYGELYTYYPEIIRKISSFTNTNSAELVLSEENDVIIPASGETKEDIATASCVTMKGVALGGDLNIFRSSLSGAFLAYYARGNLKTQISKVAQGDSVVHLYPAQLEKLKIAVPCSLQEQQKIADCLSSLDELIELEARQYEALRQHKKGLMQQLFPREGETTPRLRFPEFRDAGEWEVKKIEDFFEVLSSKRVLQKDWASHGVPFYRTRELVSLYKNEPFSSEIFISKELFSELSQKYGVPTAGDFLVSGVGTLGIAYQVKAGDKFYFKDGNVLWFKLKKGIVSTFFKYCFQSDIIQSQILGQTSISTVGTFTIQNAKKTIFLCPYDIKEQQKIADCLSSLDELIELQSQKVEALKQHKKGLMQQLFPQEVA